MFKYREFYKRARQISGLPELEPTRVSAGTTLTIGFVTQKTSLTVIPLNPDATDVDTKEIEEEGHTWYKVTIHAGTALCTWTDPHGHTSHALLNVVAIADSHVAQRFAGYCQLWKIMAEKGVTFDFLMSMANVAGIANVADAIRFAEWYTAHPQPFTIDQLASYIESDLFNVVRDYLAKSEFRAFTKDQLTGILQGAQLYAASLTTRAESSAEDEADELEDELED